MPALPSFDELPRLPDSDLRHAWGVFGADDVLGTINLLTAERVRAAADLVISGQVISLVLPLDVPNPPLFGRDPYRHEVFALNRNDMDDRLDCFHPQGSTQWDGLGHVRCGKHGYWGGRTTDPVEGQNELGIEHVAEHGIVGRGVLADVAEWAAERGRPISALEPETVSAQDIAATLDSQEVTLEPGDVLCVRTGWISAYRNLDAAGRAAIALHPASVGLLADEAMARFLWNAHISALCCDNPAIELPFGDPAVGSLHRRLLPLLGVTLGELFDFEVLSNLCRRERRWTFLFTAAPLRLPGGLGSPANALAVL
jgi:kynurenine formamidase